MDVSGMVGTGADGEVWQRRRADMRQVRKRKTRKNKNDRDRENGKDDMTQVKENNMVNIKTDTKRRGTEKETKKSRLARRRSGMS